MKMHSFHITLTVGRVAQSFLTESANESQLKQSNSFYESVTTYTTVESWPKWLQ